MLAEDLFKLLKENGISCFTGVPDSLLKDFCAYVTDNTNEKEHIITANEGNAIALAAGHYLATSKPALVYMQNSGLGNSVNPLLSLTDEEVYNIPCLLLIGMRGEIGVKDEPQHIKQGKVTDTLLDVMGIKYSYLPQNFQQAKPLILTALNYMNETKKTYAFLVRKGCFEPYILKNKRQNGYSLNRENVIEQVLSRLSCSDTVVSTTGHISREIYEIRERLNEGHEKDFLTVGSMGHASSIALGIALEKEDRNIYCFDGDGAFLMHMGAVVINASRKLSNFKHILLNNEAHDSVGSQPTAVNSANITSIALNAGYNKVYSVKTQEELNNVLNDFISDKGPALLEIKIKCGTRKDLGRPKEKPFINKQIFMENLNQIEYKYSRAINLLPKILNSENAKNILVFTGNKSFENIKSYFEENLKGFNINYYNDFSVNPKEEEVKKAVSKITNNIDIIIAIGGGSVLDFAKAFRYYNKIKHKLIAIPTTAGSGAEATQFAVLYINGTKTSIDNKLILPDYAVLDYTLLKNNPKYLRACTALDCFSHAIESFWSVNSTPESRKCAKNAIILCRENIINYVNSNDEKTMENMLEASHLAGKAINISRTTASHAISYTLTSNFSIPHGHAVAITLPRLFIFNANVNSSNISDSRGLEFVQNIMGELKELIGSNPQKYFYDLFEQIGITYSLKDLNINDLDLIINKVNQERLKNNPVKLNKEDIKLLFIP